MKLQTNRSAGRLAPPGLGRGPSARAVPFSTVSRAEMACPDNDWITGPLVHQSASAPKANGNTLGLEPEPVFSIIRTASKPTRKVRGRGGEKSARRGVAAVGLPQASHGALPSLVVGPGEFKVALLPRDKVEAVGADDLPLLGSADATPEARPRRFKAVIPAPAFEVPPQAV